MNMSYSEMDQRISILTQYKEHDEYGGYDVKWDEYGVFWAKIESVYIDNKNVNKNKKIECLYTFIVRNNGDFRIPMMVKYLDECFIAKKLKILDSQKKYIKIITVKE
jgi:head-tail adaptor